MALPKREKAPAIDDDGSAFFASLSYIFSLEVLPNFAALYPYFRPCCYKQLQHYGPHDDTRTTGIASLICTLLTHHFSRSNMSLIFIPPLPPPPQYLTAILSTGPLPAITLGLDDTPYVHANLLMAGRAVCIILFLLFSLSLFCPPISLFLLLLDRMV